jgi:defect-in-organelle-trafficking protein DotD
MLEHRTIPQFSVIRVLPVLLALGGCQITGSTTPAPVTTVNPIMAKIAESAERTAAALTRLAEIENAKTTPPVALPDVAALPQELAQPVSLLWDGPIEPLVQSLARQAGYAYRVIGAPPSLSIVVRVTADNKPLAHILADAGYQAGTRATVRIWSDVVELIYSS